MVPCSSRMRSDLKKVVSSLMGPFFHWTYLGRGWIVPLRAATALFLAALVFLKKKKFKRREKKEKGCKNLLTGLS